MKASVGVDDEVDSNGSVVFRVYADALEVYDSGVMNGASATQPVDVPIAGATRLRLLVTDSGDDIRYDHADWADARIECEGSNVSSPNTALSLLGVVATAGALVAAGLALRRREHHRIGEGRRRDQPGGSDHRFVRRRRRRSLTPLDAFRFDGEEQ
jgi:hypothetical protein